MTQSSCKGDTKSKSHTSVKLAPVRVFSCKHPISSRNVTLMRDPMSKAQAEDGKTPNRWRHLSTSRCYRSLVLCNTAVKRIAHV